MDWITGNVLPYLELVALIITVPTLVYGLIATRLFWIKRTLVRSREWNLKSAGFDDISNSDIRTRVDALCNLEAFNVGGEVNWLCSVLGKGKSESLTITQLADKRRLQNLATAYDNHRAQLNRRVLLTAEQVPLIGQMVQLAADTASYLRILAAGERKIVAPNIRITIPGRAVSLDFTAFPQPGTGVHAFDLVVSFRRHLTVPEQGPHVWLETHTFADTREIPTNDAEQQRLASMFTSGRSFDGILPRLVESAIERDSTSGRSRLLVSLAACTYSSVVLDHYPGREQVAQYLGVTSGEGSVARGVRESEFVHGQRVGLLTLSMIVMTRDGYIALPRRSKIIGSHEDRYAPSVNGNLELLGRKGIAIDLDAFGNPDPVLAMAREAKEELGLVVDPDAVVITGLVKFDAPTERGTNILLALTRSRLTLDELAHQMTYADPVEGVWENGNDLLGLRIPATQEEFDDIVQWLIDYKYLTPHATAASIAALVSSTRFTFAPERFTSGASDIVPASHLFRKVQIGATQDIPIEV